MILDKLVISNGLRLGIFAALTTALIAGVNHLTADKITDSEHQHLLASLNELVPVQHYNNTLIQDTITIKDSAFLNLTQVETAYRARFNGQNVAIILPVIAPDGYSGQIKLLVAIKEDATLLGVRVISHKETAGLGDAIEKTKSDWIDVFRGRSLSNTLHWKVKRDGGDFDQLTGATISPRAIVKAVHNALLYYQQHQKTLFLPSRT